MSKDRNTMAKRQREAEKRDKAARKREKREMRQSQPTAAPASAPFLSDSSLNEGQARVLAIFRRYLMTTGQMLCLSGHELDSNRSTLERLVEEGLLVAESFKGSYSLTPSGFDAMRGLATTHSA